MIIGIVGSRRRNTKEDYQKVEEAFLKIIKMVMQSALVDVLKVEINSQSRLR